MLSLFRKKTQKIERSDAEDLAADQSLSLLARLKTGLQKTASHLGGQLDDIFNKKILDADTLARLEEALIAADIGVATSSNIVQELAGRKFANDIDGQTLRGVLAEMIAAKLTPHARPLSIDAAKSPYVILVAGVNGAGKTTTIGKMASFLEDQGHRVMVVAADTFRAGAREQLNVWAKRSENVKFFYRPNVVDPAALAYDALLEARKQSFDVLIVDTAGRLHTKQNLMEELAKIPRVLKKLDPSAPHDNLIVLDATTGQNAIAQVENFGKAIALTGLVITKLDGTAKGGVICAIAEKTALPIVAIGVGEDRHDLQAFNPDDFSKNLLGL